MRDLATASGDFVDLLRHHRRHQQVARLGPRGTRLTAASGRQYVIGDLGLERVLTAADPRRDGNRKLRSREPLLTHGRDSLVGREFALDYVETFREQVAARLHVSRRADHRPVRPGPAAPRSATPAPHTRPR